MKIEDLRIRNLIEYDLTTHVVDGINQEHKVVGFFEKKM